MDTHISDRLDPLVLDLVEWIAAGPRPYRDVMDAWRTSCPRLTVWEDAVDRGFLEQRRADGRGVEVVITDCGRRFLQSHRPGIRRVAVVAPTLPEAGHLNLAALSVIE